MLPIDLSGKRALVAGIADETTDGHCSLTCSGGASVVLERGLLL